MRWLQLAPCLGLLIASGCHDYGVLQKTFCDTATKEVSDGHGHTNVVPMALCDGFEADALDANLWTKDATADASVEVDGVTRDGALTLANRGHRSLVVAAGQAGHAQVVERAITSSVSATPSGQANDTYLSIRFFVNVASGQLPGVVDVVSVEDVAGKQRAAFQIVNGYFALYDADNDRRVMSGGQSSFRTWDCLELRFGNSLTLWAGGAPIFALPSFPRGTGLATTRIGIARQVGDPFTNRETLWIDDVIIDNQNIGCDR